jgi:hypothetical protein
MANGHQVVVNGHPVHRFAGDTAAGQVKGQGVTDQWGKWWALSPMGNRIATMRTTTTAPGSGSGY